MTDTILGLLGSTLFLPLLAAYVIVAVAGVVMLILRPPPRSRASR
jgi:hypothetical protein